MKPNIEVHIDELVLHGFALGDRDAIAQAVQQDLERQLAGADTPAALLQDREIGRVDGGSIQLTSGARPQVVGAQIAGAVYGGLNQAK